MKLRIDKLGIFFMLVVVINYHELFMCKFDIKKATFYVLVVDSNWLKALCIVCEEYLNSFCDQLPLLF